jgi:hypothetical protein
LVFRETGCRVKLLFDIDQPKEVLSVDEKGGDLPNSFSSAPFMVMRQNREQTNGVPGHVDLIYVASIEDWSSLSSNSILVDIDTIRKSSLDRMQLWPDTREAIMRAHHTYAMLVNSPKVPFVSGGKQ